MHKNIYFNKKYKYAKILSATIIKYYVNNIIEFLEIIDTKAYDISVKIVNNL